MLRALCERGIIPDLLVGTSIGAVNAAFFAGQPTLEGTYLAGEMWRKIEVEDVFPKSLLHGS
jgi:NTE family protein